MTIRNRLALYTSGAWGRFLPPFNAVITVNERRDASVISIPFGGTEVVYSKRTGWGINFEAEPDSSTVLAGLQFQDSLRNALIDANGYAREVHFCWWADTLGNIDRIFRYCKLTSPLNFSHSRFEQHRRFAFQLTAEDPGEYNTEPGGSRPGTSDYEDWVFNAGTGSAAVPIAQAQQASVHFTGLLAVTSAANISRMQKKITLGGTGNQAITRIEIASAQLDAAASGNTTIVVSDAEWGGAGNTIVATLDETEYADSNTGSITVAAGSPIYVFVTAILGGHADVDIIITYGSA